MNCYYKYVLEMRHDFDRYDGPEELHLIEISALKVRMPKEGGGHEVVSIDATPHYQYTLGNQQPYKDWLVANNHLYDESLASFEHLMTDDSRYLGGEHAMSHILHDDDMVILDGVHRATRLFQLGVIYAPALRKIT